MHLLISLILLSISSAVFACAGTNTSLDDILKDPAIKRMLAEPLRPSAQVDEIETLSKAEIRTQKISELEAEVATLEASRGATPAEVARVRRRLEDLKAQEDIERMLKQPWRLKSDAEELPGELPDKLPREDFLSDTTPEALKKEFVIPQYDDTPITDADRAAFAEMLKKPIRQNPYDSALESFTTASERYPVSSKYRDPLTGERIDVEVVGLVRSSDVADIVSIKYRTPDGRRVTKEVRMTSLTHESRGYDKPLDNRETLLASERFKSSDKEGTTERVVDQMAQEAMTSADRAEYMSLQQQLDSRQGGIDEMLKLISRQDDIALKYAPLRVHEVETLTDNLDGLEKGVELTLTPGEKRAIADIRRIIDLREGNPRVLEDVGLFTRAKDISEESVLKSRFTNRRRAISSEIKSLTGEGRSIPFEKRNIWSSSALSRDIGGLRGSSKMKQHLDSISEFLKHEQFLSSDNARAVETAVRDIRWRIKSDGLKVPNSEDFLRFLELRLEDYKLSQGP